MTTKEILTSGHSNDTISDPPPPRYKLMVQFADGKAPNRGNHPPGCHISNVFIPCHNQIYIKYPLIFIEVGLDSYPVDEPQ